MTSKILLIGILLLLFIPNLKSQILIPYRVIDKWGFADTTGVLKIQPKYDNVEFLRNGNFIVSENSKWGVINFINDKKNEIVPIAYSTIMNNGKGILKCINANTDTIYYDLYGVNRSKKEFGEFSIDSKEIKSSNTKSYPYYKKYKEGNEVGLIKVDYPHKKDTIFKAGLYEDFDYLLNADDLYIVRKNNKYGVVNSGNNLILDFKFDEIDSKISDYLGSKRKVNLFFAVSQGKKWGIIGIPTIMTRKNGISFISLNNNLEQKYYTYLDCVYDSIKKTSNLLYLVTNRENKQGIVNTKNYKGITSVKYAKISEKVISINNFEVFEVYDYNGRKYYVGENGIEYIKE